MRRPGADLAFRQFRTSGDPEALAAVFDACAPELFRLALHLVRDVDVAEDLVQATFLVAIESAQTFDPARSVQAWLTGILTNRARLARRSANRQPDPGRLRAPAAATPPEAAEGVELDEAVERAIAALPVAYRPVLNLHLRHGLGAAQIAVSLERAPGTVRSQITRGLELLRRSLPVGLASMALLTVSSRGLAAVRATVLQQAGVASGVAAGVAPVVWNGALLMKKSVTAVWIAGALAIGFASMWMLGVFDEALVQESEAPGPLATASEGAARGDERPVEAQRQPTERAEEPAHLAARDAVPVAFPAQRSIGAIYGKIVDDSGAAVAGAEVSVRSTPGSLPYGLEIEDDRSVRKAVTTGEDGVFRFSKLPSGPYRIRAVKDRASSKRWVTVDRDTERISMRLGRDAVRRPVVVSVVDRANAPVSGATVEVYGVVGGTQRGTESTPPARATTDEHGQCRFAAPLRALLVARSPRGESGTLSFDAVSHRPFPTVRVAAAGSLLVRICGVTAHARKLIRPRVQALSTSDTAYYWTYGMRVSGTATGDGFLFDNLPAGSYSVTLPTPSDWRIATNARDGWGEPKPPAAKVNAGVRTNLDLAVTRAGRIEGSVKLAGRAVAFARVTATLVPANINYTESFVLHGAHVWRLDHDQRNAGLHPFAHVETRTNAKGRYVLSGLQPGKHRVQVFASGLTYDREEAVEVADGGVVALQHALQPAGVLQGAVTGFSYVGVVPEGEQKPAMLAIIGGGHFTFPGLAAGRYAVGSFHSDPSQGWRKIGEATVTAGKTTWVDLRKRNKPVQLSGYLYDAAGPVSGALVGVGRATHRTGANGSFRIDRDHPVNQHFHILAVHIDGFTYQLPFPEQAYGQKRWSGNFRLGAHSLAIRTVDASDNPVASKLTFESARVGMRAPSVRGTLRSRVAAPVSVHRLMPGRYAITAEFASGYRLKREVSVPQTVQVELREPPSGKLTVTVENEKGGLVRGCRVYVQTWTGSGPAPRDAAEFRKSATFVSARTDANGIVRFGALRAGTVRVVVQRQMFDSGKEVGRVELRAGADEKLSALLRY